MRKILFPIQKLAMVFFYFQLLFQLDKSTYAILSILLMTLSLIMEGARPYTPLLFIIIILQMFDYLIPQVIIIILAGLVGAVLKIYDINVPIKGPYLMGHRYKNLQFNERNLFLSIFYPTLTKTKKIQWIPNKDYNKVLYEIFYVDPKMRRMPYQIFQLIVSYIHKIYMPAQQLSPYLSQTQINQIENNSSKIKQNMNKIIVFSHGLGSHLNAYTSIFASWASQGYTIVSLNHVKDEVCVDYLKSPKSDPQSLRDYIYPFRLRDLQIRVKEIAHVIQQVQKPSFMKQNLNVDIPIKQIIIAGHSYGGSSAIATKAHLNKIYKQAPQKLNKINKVIALDPWLFPFSQQIYNNLNNQNILIINSQFFYEQVPYLYNLERHFVRLKQNNKNIKAFMIKGMDHIAQCDMAYVFGNILQIIGTIKLYQFTDSFMALNQIICQQFLKEKSKQQILQITNKFIQDRKMNLSRIEVKQEYRTTRSITFGGTEDKNIVQVIDKI